MDLKTETMTFTVNFLKIILESGKVFYADKYTTHPVGIYAFGSFDNEVKEENKMYFFPHVKIEYAVFSAENIKTDNKAKEKKAAG